MGECGNGEPADDDALRFCADFAAELRVRGVSFRRAEVLSGWGKSTIASASRGPGLPNIDLVVDVLGAIGADRDDVEAWRGRHRRLRSTGAPPPSSPSPDAGPEANETVGATRRTRRRRMEIGALVAVTAIAIGLAVALVTVGSRDAAAPASRTVVVQNKIATGPSALIEDDSPSYLGARPVARCANVPGCKIAGTDLSSGDTVVAECQLQGDFITNADVRSPGIGQNPNATTSSLWLGARAPDGRRGYISEVYLAPPYRGGLGLAPC